MVDPHKSYKDHFRRRVNSYRIFDIIYIQQSRIPLSIDSLTYIFFFFLVHGGQTGVLVVRVSVSDIRHLYGTIPTENIDK